jgi:hypothetical protein
MPLEDGQVQIRGLLLGCGTPYEVTGFNPWDRAARTMAGEGRAWNHGAWGGAEFLDETVVPLRVYTKAASAAPAQWLALHQDLVAAFEPIGDATVEVELRFAAAGSEFVMFGRPRTAQVEVDMLRVHRGRSWTSLAFAALDPRIYSGAEQVQVLGLPQFTGGLTVPFTVPFTVSGVLVDGRADVVNAGKAPTPLHVRIDGPVNAPRFAVQHPDGSVESLRFLLDLAAGQWLTIDTGSHLVLLNDVASRRGQTVGEFPLLRPGTSTLRFDAAEFNDQAELTARWRHAW